MSTTHRVAFLWGTWQSPMHAAAKSIVEGGGDALVVAKFADARAPHAGLRWNAGYERVSSERSDAGLLSELRRFKPHVLLCGGWNNGRARALTRDSGASVRVVCFDNQFRGDIRQRMGRLAAPRLIHRTFDFAWVPGDRQAILARYLGFTWPKIKTGLFPTDPDIVPSTPPRTDGFLFVGAREARKGFESLIEGYRMYTARADPTNVWPLRLAGTGADPGIANVADLGFLSGASLLRDAYSTSRVSLMLGSREAWGISLQEAAAAGHGLIAANEVGASHELVSPWVNGIRVPADNPQEVARAMDWMAAGHDWARIARHSQELAQRFSSSAWLQQLGDLR